MQLLTVNRESALDIGSKNRLIILGILLIGAVMANLDAVMVNIALPTITTFFNVSIAQSQWAVTGYILASASLLIIFGKISEYTGKTKLYLAGFAIFTISSLACGLATNIIQLVVFRVIQGIGGSMVYGVVGALLFEVSLPEERGRSMGYVASAVAGATLVGPALGGFIIDMFGWQYIFLINVPIGIVLLAFAVRYMNIPEVNSKNIGIDWIGGGALIIFMIALLMFFDEFANTTLISMPLIAYGLMSGVSSVIFIVRESRCEKPLLNLSIFSNKKFNRPVISYFLFYAGLNIANIVLPFYLEGVMGFTSLKVGTIFMVTPLFMFLVSPVGGWLYDKHHRKYAAGVGALIAAISYFLQSFAFLTINLSLVIMALVIGGVGNGFYQGPITTEIQESLPLKHNAVASSVASTARYIGIALGVSIASIIITMEMSLAGYHGPILLAGSFLSNAIVIAIKVSGIICLLSAITAISRNI